MINNLRYGLLITPIQITQFIICLVFMLPEAIDALAFDGARCGTTKRAGAWMLFAYGTYLYLFTRMFAVKKKTAAGKKA